MQVVVVVVVGWWGGQGFGESGGEERVCRRRHRLLASRMPTCTHSMNHPPTWTGNGVSERRRDLRRARQAVERPQGTCVCLSALFLCSLSPLASPPPLFTTSPTYPPNPPNQYYIKPFVQRKQRYNRWVRRRSLEKINNLLERVRYEKARFVCGWVGGLVGGSRRFIPCDTNGRVAHQVSYLFSHT